MFPPEPEGHRQLGTKLMTSSLCQAMAEVSRHVSLYLYFGHKIFAQRKKAKKKAYICSLRKLVSVRRTLYKIGAKTKIVSLLKYYVCMINCCIKKNIVLRFLYMNEKKITAISSFSIFVSTRRAQQVKINQKGS